MTTSTPRPVAPDSVHVWRGFRSSAKTQEAFVEFLGTVFLPSCSLLQPNAGLHAYVPSMMRHDGKPPTIPDQTALMFWTTQQTYHDAFKTVAVRAYTNLHGDAYGEGSAAEFPIALGDHVKAEQPYYLIDRPADWMLGRVHHLVGARPDGQDADDFLNTVYTWARAIRDAPPEGLEAGLLCAGEQYVAAWLMWSPEAKSSDPLDQLAARTVPWLYETAETYDIPAGLWDPWPGIDLAVPGSLNIQLDRPDHTEV